MGWSKCLEDNLKMFYDRQYMEQEHQPKSTKGFSYLDATPTKEETVERSDKSWYT